MLWLIKLIIGTAFSLAITFFVINGWGNLVSHIVTYLSNHPKLNLVGKKKSKK